MFIPFCRGEGQREGEKGFEASDNTETDVGLESMNQETTTCARVGPLTD